MVHLSHWCLPSWTEKWGIVDEIEANWMVYTVLPEPKPTPVLNTASSSQHSTSCWLDLLSLWPMLQRSMAWGPSWLKPVICMDCGGWRSTLEHSIKVRRGVCCSLSRGWVKDHFKTPSSLGGYFTHPNQCKLVRDAILEWCTKVGSLATPDPIVLSSLVGPRRETT